MEEIYNLDEIYSSSIHSTSEVISFSSWNQHTLDKQINETTLLSPSERACSRAGRSMSQAQEHVLAERKRRENLAQLFISLSKVLPGIKKLDKASLLGDAINHLKELQERINFLEEETVSMSKRNRVDADCYSTSSSSDDDSQVLIKARVSDTRVLIRIHCKKQSGLVSRVSCQMEKIGLRVVDMRIMPFGVEALDITIMAEMQSEFRGTVKEIVDHLQMIFVTAL